VVSWVAALSTCQARATHRRWSSFMPVAMPRPGPAAMVCPPPTASQPFGHVASPRASVGSPVPAGIVTVLRV
jgi:hypothetical protein